ncbi:MAG: MurR/RpiR family transcriptional regulator [Oscillospiraceae bacterium]
MEKDLFQVIKQKLSKMSKGHRQIAAFILEHYDKAAYMTALRLGVTVGVSESTVVRFAFELGFEGYPQLQKTLQDFMKSRLTAVQRIEVMSGLTDGEGILDKVLNHDIEKIRRTLDETSREDFARAVDSIAAGGVIYIIGLRSSAPLASFLGYYLNLISPNVRVVGNSVQNDLFEQIIRIGAGDVMIGISFPRYSKQTVKALSYAKDSGACVVALTDSKASPLAEFADHLLLARSDMASFVDSLVAPLSLINALIVAVSAKNRAQISENFVKLEKLWEEYHVYETSGDGE